MCKSCLEKHIATAAVLATEVEEVPERKVERLMCIGNLSCAEQHARDDGNAAFADRVRAARLAFQKDGDAAEVRKLVGALALAQEESRDGK